MVSSKKFNDLQDQLDTLKHARGSCWINRGFALLIGALVIIIALWLKDVLVALDVAYAYLSGCVFVPVLASFILKKFSHKAGLYSLAVSRIVLHF